MELDIRFYALAKKFAVPDATPRLDLFWDALSGKYMNRAYHNLEHIERGLIVLDDMKDEDLHRGKQFDEKFWDEIELAFYYHDCMKDEQTSATYFDRQFSPWSVPVDNVIRLILATKHDRLPLDYQAAHICDIDLSIFGGSFREYFEYERNIREEYKHVPYELYAPARLLVLEKFFKRPFMYCTQYGRERFERVGKMRLQNSINTLNQSMPSF